MYFRSTVRTFFQAVDEECAAADPPEISDAQNKRKRCRE
ncbi:unnamed protein product [Brassica oleracea var. botrytis]|uniref:(rape) hypothetical protein n=1 Tax=Brassica napus TaxID=3708 RepID=A0A816QH18_BRANA|nr:unnamed protein product [Brassica napus]